MKLFQSLALVIFTVFITGISSPIAAQAEKPKAYGVLVDNTRSLEKRFDQIILVSKHVVNHVSSRGPVQLFSFKWTRDESYFVIPISGVDHYEGGNYDRAVGTMGLAWTQDSRSLEQYIAGLSVVRGHTDLFGAIRSVAESLDAKSGDSNNAQLEKIIILVTDGDHRMEMFGGGSIETDDERKKRDGTLRKYLKESRIKVFAVGITDGLDSSSMMGESPRLRAENFLRKLTKETGGRVVFSRSKNPNADQLVNELLRKR
jgi:hypothetical protein